MSDTPSFAAVPDPQAVRLPIEDYLPSGRDQRQLDLAAYAVSARCLERFGLPPWRKPSQWSSSDAVVASQTARRYDLVSDIAAAGRYGYHVHLTPAFVANDHAVAAIVQGDRRRVRRDLSSSAAIRGVLLGETQAGRIVHKHAGRKVPAGGCEGAALQELTAGNGRDPDAVAIEIKADEFSKTLGDPVVVAATRAWSRCMLDAGYRYASPEAASSDAAWKTSVPSQREREIAVSDVKCSQRVNLVGISLGVEAQLEDASIAAHRAHLEAARSRLRAQRLRVRKVLHETR